MSRLLTLALVLALSVAALPSCGGDSHAAVTEDSLDLMSETADILAGVTDEASARAAAPKLDKLTKKAEAIQKRTEALGDLDAEEEARLQEKYEARMDEITQSMMETMMRLSQEPGVMEVLGDSIQKLR